jgi:uncharacterized membrane protein
VAQLTRRLAAWGYVGGVVAWATWLIVLPRCLDAQRLPPRLASVAAWTYWVSGWVCHQDPVRTFAVGVWPLPVCARCTGLYVGAAIGAVVGLLSAWPAAPPGRLARSGTLRVVRVTLIVSALPTGVLWALEWLGHVPVTNLLRWLGALPLGAAISWLIVGVVRGGLLTDKARGPGVH